MLLRYLENAVLSKATKTKEANGTYTEQLSKVRDYKVQERELDDEISASIYGANVHKMLRIKSPKKELENYLYPKVTNNQDNVSDYYITIKNRRYKIVSVNSQGIDLELV